MILLAIRPSGQSSLSLSLLAMQGGEDEADVTWSPLAPATFEGKQPQLIVVQGHNLGEMYNVQGLHTLGRGRDADIRVHGDGISRLHARVCLTADAVTLEDLSSSNGSFVNGQRVETVALADGDKIELGGTILKFAYQDGIEQDFLREMFELAWRDSLTQTYNKDYLRKRLQLEFSIAERNQTALSLVMFDVDHLTQINQAYGLSAGDFVLATLAQAVMPMMQSEDALARCGGDRFVVLSHSAAGSSGAVVSERIRAMAETCPFEYEAKRIPVTVSVGCATIPCAGIRVPEDLLASARRALLEAKRRGRNRVVGGCTESA